MAVAVADYMDDDLLGPLRWGGLLDEPSHCRATVEMVSNSGGEQAVGRTTTVATFAVPSSTEAQTIEIDISILGDVTLTSTPQGGTAAARASFEIRTRSGRRASPVATIMMRELSVGVVDGYDAEDIDLAEIASVDIGAGDGSDVPILVEIVARLTATGPAEAKLDLTGGGRGIRVSRKVVGRTGGFVVNDYEAPIPCKGRKPLPF